MTAKRISAKQLARLLTEAGVPSDKRKVMKWRNSEGDRTIAEDAALALDKTFGTVNVFGQFAYKPQNRGTRSALSEQIAARIDELEERIRQLEEAQ